MPVGHHQPAELAQLGDQQPDQVVDVAEDVDTGDEDSDVENVDIELCWLTRTFIKVSMDITDDGVSLHQD